MIPSRLALLAAAAALAAACSKDEAPPAARFPSAAGDPRATAPAAEPQPPPSPAPVPASAPGAEGGLALAYAGGRPLAWWNERLTRLRAEGPPALYELTVERARANGLRVVEQDAAVRVEPAEARP
jgi:hypothetical protein